MEIIWFGNCAEKLDEGIDEIEIDLDPGIVVLQVDEVLIPIVVVLCVVVWVLIIVEWSLKISEVITDVAGDINNTPPSVVSSVEILVKVVDVIPYFVDSKDIIDIGVIIEVFPYSMCVVIGVEAVNVVCISVALLKFNLVNSDVILLSVSCVVASTVVGIVVDGEYISVEIIVGFLRVINFLVVRSKFLVVFISWDNVSISVDTDFSDVDIIVVNSGFIVMVVDKPVILVGANEGIEVEFKITVFSDGWVIAEIDEAEDICV